MLHIVSYIHGFHEKGFRSDCQVTILWFSIKTGTRDYITQPKKKFKIISTSPGIKSFSTCREGAVRAACTGSRVQSKGHTGGLAWPMCIVV